MYSFGSKSVVTYPFPWKQKDSSFFSEKPIFRPISLILVQKQENIHVLLQMSFIILCEAFSHKTNALFKFLKKMVAIATNFPNV